MCALLILHHTFPRAREYSAAGSGHWSMVLQKQLPTQ